MEFLAANLVLKEGRRRPMAPPFFLFGFFYSERRDSTGLARAARNDFHPTDSMAMARARPQAVRKVPTSGPS